MPAENPFDMNQALKTMVQTELGQMMPMLAAQSTLIAGNALRAQAFAMTANVNPSDFICPPAKLADGGCIVLLRNLKHVVNTYRLIVAPAYGRRYAGKPSNTVVGRAIVIFAEDETDLVKTQYINLSDEAKKELERQLKVIQLEPDATLELCLAVVNEEIPGYEYFVDPEASKATDSTVTTPDGTPPSEPAADEQAKLDLDAASSTSNETKAEPNTATAAQTTPEAASTSA